MTFRRQLSFSIVALILALTTALSVIYLRYLLEVQLRETVDQAKSVMGQVSSAILGDMSDLTEAPTIDERLDLLRQAVRGNDDLREVLERSLGSFYNIVEIAVSDDKGEVLSSSGPSERWARRPELQELAERGFIEQLRAVYGPQRDYEISSSFTYEGRTALVLHVAVSTAFLGEKMNPQIRKLGLVSLFAMLASLVLATLFSRLAFRPLDRLSEAIDRMTKGEFAAPPPEPERRGTEYAVISSKLSVLGQQFRDAREGISSLRGNMEQLMTKLEGAVLLFDAADRLIIASAPAESFLGAGRWEMMGRTIEEVFPAGTPMGALVSSAARLGQAVQNQVIELQPAGAENGSAEPTRVLLSVELMEDFTNRRRLGTLVLLRDAETRREIASQMEVSTRLAAISRLTSGVAHEIKNPLNAITLHLELLKNRLKQNLPEPAPEVEVIGREMARLDRVVKTFLDFTRPVDLRLTEVRLESLLDEIAALAKPEAQACKVRVEVLNGASDVLVRADRDLLKQAVLNLAVNGIQAMPLGGDLSLAVACVGTEAEISVSDQGEGIQPKDREKIFRLYYTTKKNGSGIGLAMTFRVVQLHNGTIDFTTELGRGTTFRIRLPVVEAQSWRPSDRPAHSA